MTKKILNLLTVLVMAISLAGVLPAVDVAAAGGVQTKVDQVVNMYKGSTSGFNHGGASGCLGFAKVATEYVFGVTFYRNNQNGAFKNVNTSSSFWDTYNNCVVGDIINNNGIPHTAMVISKESSSITVIHWRKGSVTVNSISSSSWSSWFGGTNQVWHANNYNTVDGTHNCNSNNSKITKNATCTATGTRTYTCSVCGKVTRTETISALGHNFNTVYVEATATSDGYTRQYCTRCNYETSAYKHPSVALNHWLTVVHSDNEKYGLKNVVGFSIIDNTANDKTNNYIIKRQNMYTGEEEILTANIHHRATGSTTSYDAAVYVNLPSKPGLYLYNVAISGTSIPHWCAGYVHAYYDGFIKKQQSAFNGKLYTICDYNGGASTRYTAMEYCEKNNSKLASIHSEVENNVIANIVNEYGYSCLLSGVNGVGWVLKHNDYPRWKWWNGNYDVTGILSDPKDNYSYVDYENWGINQPSKNKWTLYLNWNYFNYYLQEGRTDAAHQEAYQCYENQIAIQPDGTWNDVGDFDESVHGFVMESEAENIVEIDAEPECVEGEGIGINDVKVQFSNGDIVSVEDYTLSGFDKDKVGQQTITVNYFGKTKNIDINVVHNYKNGTCTVCGNKDPNYTEPTNPKPSDTLPASLKFSDKSITINVNEFTYIDVTANFDLTESISVNMYCDSNGLGLGYSRFENGRSARLFIHGLKIGTHELRVELYNKDTDECLISDTVQVIVNETTSDQSDQINPSNYSIKPLDNPTQSLNSTPTSAQTATNVPTNATPKITLSIDTTVTNPAKVKAVKLTAKKKKLNVKWKKIGGATGYEVMYAKNNKFKGKKTVKVKKNKVTLKRLKSKKKYFVKVRAYKIVNGNKKYGKWSKTVKVKVK